MTAHLGEAAALLTALCYSASSIFFTAAGKRFGPMVSNRLRLAVAILLLGTVHWMAMGTPLPLSAGTARWMWLGSSGIVGLAIGDLFLFQAYILLGPRLGLLFLSLSPALATLLAWIALGEKLTIVSIIGIAITLAGITWVVLEGHPNGKPGGEKQEDTSRKKYTRGIIAGLVAAAGQAIGLVLAKNGLMGGFPALSGNVIRMTAAFIAIWIFTAIQGQIGLTFRSANEKRPALLYILGGAILGPLIGVSLSLFAIQNTKIGIASTIIALPPIFLLPVGHFLFKEHISWRSVLGTVIAIIGVAVLFWT